MIYCIHGIGPNLILILKKTVFKEKKSNFLNGLRSDNNTILVNENCEF